MHLYLQLTRSLAVTLIWLYCNKLVLRYVRLRVSDLGQVSIPQRGIVTTINGLKFKVIPGWNDYVKESYAISRDALKWWISNNRPRDGLIYHNMRTTRAQFKYAFNVTKKLHVLMH